MNKINLYKKVYNMEKISKDWRNDIYDVFKDIGISLVSHIPDAGHTPLIDLCSIFIIVFKSSYKFWYITKNHKKS